MHINESIMLVQARYLHRNMPIFILSSYVGAGAFVALLWDTITPSHLIAWGAAEFINPNFRAVLWWKYRGVIFEPASARRFVRWTMLGAVLESSMWAAAMFFFYPQCPLPQQFLFFAAIIICNIAGMSGNLFHYKTVLATSLPFSLTGIFVIASQRPIFYTVLIGLLLFVPMMLYFAWRLHRLVIKSLQLRFENIDLVAQLTAQKEAAEAAALSKSRFLAAASHDLRQPMHALNLYLGVLTGCGLPEQAAPVLAKVRQCAQTMDEMFRALLDISRLDASVVHPDIKAFPIAPLLERIRTELTPQAHLKGLELRVAPCSLCVSSDPVLVERILRNLVSNAVRYTAHGKILIGCRRTASGLRLAVHDTGLGIAPDQQKTIFEEFYQVGNPERDRAQGLGLGLAIVRRLALLLGTQVTLESTLGRGSMFSIELSGAACPEGTFDQVAPEGVNLNNVAGKMIAVVDDELAILDAMRHLLEQWGCTVITATSGNEAAAKLSVAVRLPDALVCDYRLRGDETGMQVVHMLRRELNHDIPALLITGDTAPDRIRQTQFSGLTVLHKPIPGGELREALSRLMESRQEEWLKLEA